MRTQEEMMSLILDVARRDSRVRAVLLSGSRTNPRVKKDQLQDFDVAFLVHEQASFQARPEWIDVFGERMIMQVPQRMSIPEDDSPGGDTFTYLMHFLDGNRIDLCLCLVQEKSLVEDSLTKVLLDKDDMYPAPLRPDDSDYCSSPPDQQLFSDCCNEFWWVSTYVIKGLLRKQPTYAKDMLEKPVRDMLMMMLDWYVGIKNDFSVNTGMSGKYLKDHLENHMWQHLLGTYPDAYLPNIWQSMGEMMKLFRKCALDVAEKLELEYDWKEDQNVSAYFLQMKAKT